MSLVLCLAALAVYAQTYRNSFVTYDDDQYVYENATVAKGLTPSGVAWAFTTFCCANWHPLTWLSHMLDCQLFGLKAGAQHLVNLAFHMAATVLLFLAFVRMTRRPWRSAAVAAIFAVHPLHVESVAWVSERKDVLSAFLGVTALLFYVRYAEKPRMRRFVPVTVVFALALMAKPMLVTFPFLLLLIDIWPLGRLAWPPSWNALKPLLREKLLLFAMVAVACVVTFIAQRKGGAMVGLSSTPLSDRLGNAAVSYAAYMWKAVWPAKLAVLYPSHTPSALGVLSGLAVLLAGTIAAFVLAGKRPYVLVGWLWYLGMLVPVIGLVQVGAQSMADRYMYLPLVGLSLAVVWLAADLVAGRRGLIIACAVVSFAAIAAFGARAYAQAAYWKSSIPLFERTLALTDGNYVIENNMGIVLDREGRADEAISHYRAALAIKPDYPNSHHNLAIILTRQGKRDEAIAHEKQALAAAPRYAEAHNNLGVLLARGGQFDDAVSHYRQALSSRPDYADAHANLGHELLKAGKLDEAYPHLLAAVQLTPGLAEAQADLGLLLAAQREYAESRTHLEESLRINPGQPEVHSNLAFVLEQLGLIEEAIAHCKESIRLNPGYVGAHYNLGVALAAQHKKTEAAAEFSEVLRISPGHPDARRALDELQQSK